MPTLAAKLSELLKVQSYDFDPDATDATQVGWFDMSEYDALMVVAIRSVGTGNLSSFKLLSNDDGSTNADATLVTHAVASEPNAAGDHVVLEVTREDIVAAGAAQRYVSAELALATDTDEFQIAYIASCKSQKASQTADQIS